MVAVRSKLTECLLQQAEAQARWAEKTSNLALPRGCPSEADRRADLAHAGHCAAAVPGVNASTDALAKQGPALLPRALLQLP